MAALAILNAIAGFLPSDIPSHNDSVLTWGNASRATGVDSESFSTRNTPFFPFASLLLSVAIKNQDMLKLMVIGGIVETFRRFTYRFLDWLSNTWFITAYFDSSDDTFEWMMVWLGKQNIWANAREVQISTASWGQAHHKGVEIPGEDTKDGYPAGSGYQKKRTLAYLPAFDTKHWLKYKGTWISVSRTKNQSSDPWSGRRQEFMEICLFTRNRRILTSLLQDAKAGYKTDDEDIVGLYIADTYNEWRRTSMRKKRPLQSIVLEPEVKSMLLDDAKEFLSSEKWYTDRGIPYRRGYLLHGVPGSGKTSLIHSIAGELGLDIYVVSLAKKGLDDAGLNELILQLPPRSIALMEDIDAAFRHAGISRDGVSGSPTEVSKEGPPAPRTPNGNGGQESDTKGVTLSGLLNALDGVAAQEGRILFATTNRYDALDEALSRDGRMDVHVEFKMATQWQAKELFRCFYPVVEAETEGKDKVFSEKSQADAKGVGLATSPWPLQMPLTREETDALAEKFAAAVPEGQFSMASLQGHLMRYKERPQDAVDAVRAWVEKESRKRGAAKPST